MYHLTIIVDVPKHISKSGELPNQFEVDYTDENTLQDLYFYLKTIGYDYPLYKLYLEYDFLPTSFRKLSSFLHGEGDVLYLNDPVRRRPVATAAVVTAAVAK